MKSKLGQVCSIGSKYYSIFAPAAVAEITLSSLHADTDFDIMKLVKNTSKTSPLSDQVILNGLLFSLPPKMLF